MSRNVSSVIPGMVAFFDSHRKVVLSRNMCKYILSSTHPSVILSCSVSQSVNANCMTHCSLVHDHNGMSHNPTLILGGGPKTCQELCRGSGLVVKFVNANCHGW